MGSEMCIRDRFIYKVNIEEKEKNITNHKDNVLVAAIIGKILLIFFLANFLTNSPLTAPNKTRKIRVIILKNIRAVD